MSISKNSIKYSIVSINERAADNKENTRKILSNFEEVYIDCVNGNIENTSEMLKNLNISLKNWSWPGKPRGGDIGLWISNINLFNKMIKENLDNILLLEDDTILSNNFLNIFNNVMEEIPKSYDFISLVFPSSSVGMYKEDAEIGLKNICSAKYNHFSTIAMMWSNKGANTIIKLLNENGIIYPIDIQIYDHFLKNNMLEGYSIKPNVEQVVFHDWNRYASTIDLDGRRGKLNV